MPRRCANFDNSGAWACCACSRCEWDCLDICSLVCHFSFLSHSLWEMARCGMKNCLKGPLGPKHPVNHLHLRTGKTQVSMPAVTSDQRSFFRRYSLWILRSLTVIILNIGTDRSEQTVQTQIRLLLMEQSDQGLLCMLFCLHLLNTILHCKIQLIKL